MKLIFLTTTAIAFGSYGTCAAQTAAVTTPSPAAFTQMLDIVQTTQLATGLHTGDFQKNAKAANTAYLYKGQGASLMRTIRRYAA